MDPPSPASAASHKGGRYLQGVWMSKCEGGRIERLTKWSDNKRDRDIGTLDQQEHNSLVKMNLVKLELRSELDILQKSRREGVRERRDAARAPKKQGKSTERPSTEAILKLPNKLQGQFREWRESSRVSAYPEKNEASELRSHKADHAKMSPGQKRIRVQPTGSASREHQNRLRHVHNRISEIGVQPSTLAKKGSPGLPKEKLKNNQAYNYRVKQLGQSNGSVLEFQDLQKDKLSNEVDNQRLNDSPSQCQIHTTDSSRKQPADHLKWISLGNSREQTQSGKEVPISGYQLERQPTYKVRGNADGLLTREETHIEWRLSSSIRQQEHDKAVQVSNKCGSLPRGSLIRPNWKSPDRSGKVLNQNAPPWINEKVVQGRLTLPENYLGRTNTRIKVLKP